MRKFNSPSAPCVLGVMTHMLVGHCFEHSGESESCFPSGIDSQAVYLGLQIYSAHCPF